MKEKIEIIVLFLILILSIIGVNYILNKETEKRFGVSNNTVDQEQNVAIEDDIQDVEISNVISVTEETFDSEVINSDKKVVIDFYADWCGPCKLFSPIFDKVSNKIEDIKFVRVNVDDEPNLATKYKAYSIPYIVVIENGEIVNTHTGLVDEYALEQMIK